MFEHIKQRYHQLNERIGIPNPDHPTDRKNRLLRHHGNVIRKECDLLLEGVSDTALYDQFIENCRIIASNEATFPREKAAARFLVTLSEKPYGKDHVEKFLSRTLSGNMELLPHEKHILSQTLSELDKYEEKDLLTRRRFGLISGCSGSFFIILGAMGHWGYKAVNHVSKEVRHQQVDNMIVQLQANPPLKDCTPEERKANVEAVDQHFTSKLAASVENKFPWSAVISCTGGAMALYLGFKSMNNSRYAQDELTAAATAFTVDSVSDVLAQTAEKHLGSQWTDELRKRRDVKTTGNGVMP